MYSGSYYINLDKCFNISCTSSCLPFLTVVSLSSNPVLPLNEIFAKNNGVCWQNNHCILSKDYASVYYKFCVLQSLAQNVCLWVAGA